MSPRARHKPVEEEIPNIDEELDNIEPSKEEMEDAEKLVDFQARFGGKDYKIRVERYIKDEAEWEHVTNCKLDGFDPLSLQKAFGGGRYRLSLFDSSFKYVKGGRQEIRIADIPKSDAPEQRLSPMQDPGVQVILQMMQAQANQASEMVKAMINANAGKPAQAPISELITALSSLQGMMPKDKDSFKGIKDALELLNAAKGLLPEKSDSEASGGVVSEILEAVKAGKELGFFNRQGLHPTPQPPMRQPMPAVVNPPASQEIATVDPIKACVDKYIPILIGWSKRGEPIDDAANFMISELYAEVLPVVVENYRPGGMKLNVEMVATYLLDKAKDPSEVEKVFTSYPVLSEHRDYVVTVIAAMVREMEAPDAPVEAQTAA